MNISNSNLNLLKIKKTYYKNISSFLLLSKQKQYKKNIVNNKPKNFTNSKLIKSIRKSNKFHKHTKIGKFKLKKKWRFWRIFKRFFLYKSKISRYNKLKWRYNNIRIAWHQYISLYSPELKNKIFKQLEKTPVKNKYSLLLLNMELRLSIILIRARFCYNKPTSYSIVKNRLININGIIIVKINKPVNMFDLVQKRKLIRDTRSKYSYQKRYLLKRTIRFKWRKRWWRHSRFLLWQVRRSSHFNMHHSKRTISWINYLEINYKIPAFILIKKPFIGELLINRNNFTISNKVMKKIYFLY